MFLLFQLHLISVSGVYFPLFMFKRAQRYSQADISQNNIDTAWWMHGFIKSSHAGAHVVKILTNQMASSLSRWNLSELC